jgi:hypothetical protein
MRGCVRRIADLGDTRNRLEVPVVARHLIVSVRIERHMLVMIAPASSTGSLIFIENFCVSY